MGGAFDALGDAILELVKFAVFAAITLATALVLFILSFMPFWTPYFYTAFIFSTFGVWLINRKIK